MAMKMTRSRVHGSARRERATVINMRRADTNKVPDSCRCWWMVATTTAHRKRRDRRGLRGVCGYGGDDVGRRVGRTALRRASNCARNERRCLRTRICNLRDLPPSRWWRRQTRRPQPRPLPFIPVLHARRPVRRRCRASTTRRSLPHSPLTSSVVCRHRDGGGGGEGVP